MPKTKDQIRTEIASALQNQTINALIEALTEANEKVQSLAEELEALKKPKE